MTFRSTTSSSDQPAAAIPARRGPGRPVDPTKDTRILQAARELLFDQGLHAVSMDAVAARARVSKTTLYARFANREMLIRAVASEQAGRFARKLNDTVENVDGLRSVLLSFAADLIDFMSHPDRLQLMRAMISQPDSGREMAQQVFRSGPMQTREHLASWLAVQAERGLLLCPAPKRSAEQLIGMLMGLRILAGLFGRTPFEPADDLLSHVTPAVDLFIAAHVRKPGTGNGY
jgi:TetR/AcrR family transcriptional repressor of mexJK operon